MLISKHERGDHLPRQARNIHECGYRHVIVRGIGKQILFEDEQDYRYFLKILEKYSKETSVSICAYCLMENHVHLLVHDAGTDTSILMKKVGVSYSAYYNRKYDRIGHLFQDRYKCENINSERYYMTVLRYILRNPEKAGLCRAEEYRWSSYHAYGRTESFLDQSLTCELVKDIDEFKNYITTENHDSCMEFGSRKTDEWATDVIRKTAGVASGTVIQQFDRQSRNLILRSLKSEGLSVRQIERLTGISRGVVQRA